MLYRCSSFLICYSYVSCPRAQVLEFNRSTLSLSTNLDNSPCVSSALTHTTKDLLHDSATPATHVSTVLQALNPHRTDKQCFAAGYLIRPCHRVTKSLSLAIVPPSFAFAPDHSYFEVDRSIRDQQQNAQRSRTSSFRKQPFTPTSQIQPSTGAKHHCTLVLRPAIVNQYNNNHPRHTLPPFIRPFSNFLSPPHSAW